MLRSMKIFTMNDIFTAPSFVPAIFVLVLLQFFMYFWDLQLFMAQHNKWSFPLGISSVNVTKSQETTDLEITKSLMENFTFCAVWTSIKRSLRDQTQIGCLWICRERERERERDRESGVTEFPTFWWRHKWLNSYFKSFKSVFENKKYKLDKLSIIFHVTFRVL